MQLLANLTDREIQMILVTVGTVPLLLLAIAAGVFFYRRSRKRSQGS